MKEGNKIKKILFPVILICCLALVLPKNVSADIGPKPSVQITFTGSKEDEYYATLLSQNDTTGPYSVWDGSLEFAQYKQGDPGYDIWKKFVEYRDTDGFYFLQEFFDCSETNALSWTYYPPNTFKVLIYYPESDTFEISEKYERYAFDSYYKMNLEESGSGVLTLKENYNYGWEIVSLFARMGATILIEVLIAFLFGFFSKKEIKFIAVVNIITQGGLNIALNVINYKSGSMAFVLAYILLELVILFTEGALYGRFLPKMSSKETKRGRAVAYAYVANPASFLIGYWIAHLVPGIF